MTAGDFEEVGLGDRALVHVGEPASGEDALSGLLLVQDGNLGFIVTAEGSDESIRETLVSFGEFMVATEPGAGEVVFDGVSGSTGGTFDVLPSVANPEVLNGLLPIHDYDLLVSDSPIEAPATPAT